MNFMKQILITDVYGIEVLDSRGNPTVEATVVLEDGHSGSAMVPSGASTGKFEAVELRDGDIADKATAEERNMWVERYGGKGVCQAVKNINTTLRDCLVGKNACNQPLIDRMMIELDSSGNKGSLGANAILAVSLANARACANSFGISLYRYLGGCNARQMPVPMMNVLNGGVHAKNRIDFQEFMIMPVGASSFADGLRMGTEVYHTLKKLLQKAGKNTAVGDEGGFAPDLQDAFEVFSYLEKAVETAGYRMGEDVVFAMDAAASELYEENSGMYYFPGESENKKETMEKNYGEEGKIPDTKDFSVVRTTEEMVSYYEKLCERFPICSIEDGLNEEDFEGWRELTKRLGDKVQLVGDDLFVTNVSRLQQGIKEKMGNAILVKVNQIGTLTEAMNAVECARENGMRGVISHRSGETEDTFIADLAVAMNVGQIKTGAPCRSERVAKYNRLLHIERELMGISEYHFQKKGE